MQSSDNQQALGKIVDLSRMLAISMLAIHFYFYGYEYFERLGLAAPLSARLLDFLGSAGLFQTFNRSKTIALIFLIISLMGVKARKQENASLKTALIMSVTGLLIYFSCKIILVLHLLQPVSMPIYMVVCSTGFLLVMTGATSISKVIKEKLSNDVSNKANESFPQQERLIENEYSVNLPARYLFQGKQRHSWINIINPFRGTIVLGTPGSGKSYYVIRHVISQHISKGFTMMVYDFKFPDLSLIAYNAFLKNRHLYPENTKCYFVSFERIIHRCNPLDPVSMEDVADAVESARTILLALNRDWIKRQGDFFVESPINFLTAIIWFLKKYDGGRYCTLPHVIELMQTDYDDLFTLLRTESEIQVLINPFMNAYLNDAMEQLEGQFGSAKIALGRLSSPVIYYVLSGDDFTLDINNPAAPKIICIGNNPQRQGVLSSVISLYMTRLLRLVNQKDKLKSSLVFDEFPTVFVGNMDTLLATARSNKVATTLAVQDLSQLKKEYGREQADVIANVTGNLIAGQVTGETARQLSERFGKIMQNRTSLSINRTDTSISKSRQLDMAIPISTISTLSAGEFIGMTADEPGQEVEQKIFHCKVENDHKRLAKEQQAFHDIPANGQVSDLTVQKNYQQIREDMKNLVYCELQRIMTDPALKHLIVKK